MARYLWKVSYSAEGAKGLLAEGGTARRAVVQKLAKAVGGKLETFYFALGEDDAYVIVEVPEVTDVAAISLAVAASGAVRVQSVQLLTPAELDEAAKKTLPYRPPGG
jgi:uncharacterized protein with GYD domain